MLYETLDKCCGGNLLRPSRDRPIGVADVGRRVGALP